MDEQQQSEETLDPIAIIGMAGRFPGAANLQEFWNNLRNGVESITHFSDEEAIAAGTDPELLKDPAFVKAHGVLDGIELFDANFFDMSPRDAKLLDPQHRIYLESAWETIEDAGYNPETYDGRIGVYAGTSFSTYLLRNILPNRMVSFPTIDRLEMALTNHKDTMPMRVSFYMNLTGPSICVGTTCSTSLVAIHLACQALWTYQCDMALAGASFLRVPPKEGYLFQEGMIYSPDGHLRTFDAESKGIITGAGTGNILLKRLSEALDDGDHIHAVIKATALNNDGSTKVGYTAPSIEGQAEVISEAMALAGVDASTVSFIEAHGTGTELGDPVEMAALKRAFRLASDNPDALPKHYCGVASTKPNIGHLNHAAGIASMLKTILTLKHKQIPPTINFKTPNPKLGLEDSPFYINDKLSDWTPPAGTPRRAGVNGFGIGGTNAHVVLEEAPEAEASGASRVHQILLLSAKTGTALDTLTANLKQHLQGNPDEALADVAYTLQVGRKPLPFRRMIVCQTREQAIEALASRTPKQTVNGVFQGGGEPPVAFMFSGQGSQYINMGRDLYEASTLRQAQGGASSAQVTNETLFREHMDRCFEICAKHNLDLRSLLYPAEGADLDSLSEQLNQTAITQPALFAIEYALAQTWMAWGLRPESMIGHSIGEYVAACIAGVFSLEDALALVIARGRMMQDMPTGSMLSVSLPVAEVEKLLGDDLALCVVNGAASCVVGGEDAAVDKLEAMLRQAQQPIGQAQQPTGQAQQPTGQAQQPAGQAVDCRRLHTSHAFHSPMMQGVVDAFTQRVAQVELHAPQIPYVSNVSGTWITPEEATDPAYWARHLRHTVQFAAGLDVLLGDTKRILLEVGPGRALSTLARQQANASAALRLGSGQGSATGASTLRQAQGDASSGQGSATATAHTILTSVRHPQEDIADQAFLLNTLGRLWIAGAVADWFAFYQDERRLRLPLPTYPFERKRYWIDPPKPGEGGFDGPQQSLAMLGMNTDEDSDSTVAKFTEYAAPRNAKEEKIAEIWRDVLNLKRVGIHDNFFELGGSSLLGSRVVAELCKAMDIELSVPDFLNAPSVAELAALIDAPASSVAEPVEAEPAEAAVAEPCPEPSRRAVEAPVITVKLRNGDKKPLFLVHAIDGFVYFYRDLANALEAGRPVYAFQAQGLDENSQPLNSVPEMASLYLKALRNLQPEGSYLLGGFSFGGAIALEMAQQLTAAGEQVDLLFLSDTPSTDFGLFNLEGNTGILHFVIRHLLKLDAQDVAWNDLSGQDLAAQIKTVLEKVSAPADMPFTLSADMLQRLVKVIDAHQTALRNYKPASYEGKILYFRAKQAIENAKPGVAEHFWLDFADGGMDIHNVPGDHQSMNYQPNVQTLADKLLQYLSKV